MHLCKFKPISSQLSDKGKGLVGVKVSSLKLLPEDPPPHDDTNIETNIILYFIVKIYSYHKQYITDFIFLTL